MGAGTATRVSAQLRQIDKVDRDAVVKQFDIWMILNLFSQGLSDGFAGSVCNMHDTTVGMAALTG